MKLYFNENLSIIKDEREANEYFYMGDNQVNVVECVFGKSVSFEPTINLLQANGRQIMNVYYTEGGTNDDGNMYYRWYLSSNNNQLSVGRLDIQIMAKYYEEKRTKCIGIVSINVQKGAWITPTVFVTGDDPNETITNMQEEINQLGTLANNLANSKVDKVNANIESGNIRKTKLSNCSAVDISINGMTIADASATSIFGHPETDWNLVNKAYVNEQDSKLPHNILYDNATSSEEGSIKIIDSEGDIVGTPAPITSVSRAYADGLGNQIDKTYKTQASAKSDYDTIINQLNDYEIANNSKVNKNIADISDLQKNKATTNDLDLDFNPANGVLTLMYSNKILGSVDLPTEMIVSSGYYDAQTQEIVLVLTNGDEIRFSASDLIDIYQGSIGEMIEVVVKDNVISAVIRDNSITEDKLNDNVKQLVAGWKDVIANEQERIRSESIRVSNENERISNEDNRISNEERRESHENNRISNENERISNERQREIAETKRQEEYENIISQIEINTADTDKMKIELSNLYEMLNGYIFESASEEFAELDSAVLPSTISVNDNLYNIADKTRTAITNVKGRTKKSSNLIPLEDVEATTKSGVTYSIKNGVITLNGTTTSYFYLTLAVSSLKAGTYYLESFSDVSNKAFLRIPYTKNGATNYNWTTSKYAGVSQTYTADGTETNMFLQLLIANDVTLNNVIIKPMLVEGSTAPTIYEPYYDGLKSTTFAGVELTGKNLLDFSKFTNQTIDQQLVITNSSKRVLSNKIYVEPSTTYTISKANSKNKFFLREYDSNNTFINEYGWISLAKEFTFTTDSNTNFIYFIFSQEVTGASGTDLPISDMKNTMLNYGSIAETYTPYNASAFTSLPFDKIELNGVGTAQDELIVSENESDSFYTLKKIERVGSYTFTGNEKLTQTSTANGSYRYWLTGLDMYATNNTSFVPNLISTLNLKIVSTANTWNNIEGITINGTVASGSNVVFEIYVASIQTASDMLQYLKGTTIYFELATPVETILKTDLTIDDITAIREAGGVIRVVDNDNAEFNVKPDVVMDIVYRKYDFDTTQATSISESEEQA